MKMDFTYFYMVESDVVKMDTFTLVNPQVKVVIVGGVRGRFKFNRGQAFCIQSVQRNICTFRHTMPDLASWTIKDTKGLLWVFYNPDHLYDKIRGLLSD